jgi:hypothetical protein
MLVWGLDSGARTFAREFVQLAAERQKVVAPEVFEPGEGEDRVAALASRIADRLEAQRAGPTAPVLDLVLLGAAFMPEAIAFPAAISEICSAIHPLHAGEVVLGLTAK